MAITKPCHGLATEGWGKPHRRSARVCGPRRRSAVRGQAPPHPPPRKVPARTCSDDAGLRSALGMSSTCRLPLMSPHASSCWVLAMAGSRKRMHRMGTDTTLLVRDGLLVWSTRSHTSTEPSNCTRGYRVRGGWRGDGWCCGAVRCGAVRPQHTRPSPHAQGGHITTQQQRPHLANKHDAGPGRAPLPTGKQGGGWWRPEHGLLAALSPQAERPVAHTQQQVTVVVGVQVEDSAGKEGHGYPQQARIHTHADKH